MGEWVWRIVMKAVGTSCLQGNIEWWVLCLVTGCVGGLQDFTGSAVPLGLIGFLNWLGLGLGLEGQGSFGGFGGHCHWAWVTEPESLNLSLSLSLTIRCTKITCKSLNLSICQSDNPRTNHSRKNHRGISLQNYHQWSETGECVCHIYPERIDNSTNEESPSITCSLEVVSADTIPIARYLFEQS